jgi:hypothetical protein
MGFNNGRVKIINGKGTYYSNEYGDEKGCQWSIQFMKSSLIIQTMNNQDNCGFGYGVYMDGTFSLKSNKVVTFFENQEGIKIFFKDIK